MNSHKVREFLEESNEIEDIHAVKDEEVGVALSLLELDQITIRDLERFLKTTAPAARLRNKPGLDVYVGMHAPPKGGPYIEDKLAELLLRWKEFTPHELHVRYELLHPFTDGNGRTGRVLWLWHMEKKGHGIAPLGFLQSFYYQTLAARKS